MVEQEELSIRLQTLKRMLSKREWKYYHIYSLENFIYHIDSIKNERCRQRVAIEINNYFDLANKKIAEESTLMIKGKELAGPIWELSYVYKVEVGFIQKPHLIITLFLVI